MILYYSGAQTPNTPQPDYEKSLGGFVSSSPVPNGGINSIFSNISQLTLEEGAVETRAIFLKNTTGVALNLNLWLEYLADTGMKFEVAFVEPNEQGGMEAIITSKHIPYNAAFLEPVATDPVELALGIDELLGIWIKRTVTSRSFTPDELFEAFEVQDYVEKHLEVRLRIQEAVAV